MYTHTYTCTVSAIVVPESLQSGQGVRHGNVTNDGNRLKESRKGEESERESVVEAFLSFNPPSLRV